MRKILFGIALAGAVLLAACTPEPSPTAAVSIDAGETHTCAALQDGTVRCWGTGQWGVLGNNSTQASLVPVTPIDLSNARGVSAGGNVSCVLQPTSGGSCWGYNGHNQLFSNTTYWPRPRDLSGPITSQLSVGHSHTCALFPDHSVTCWGDNTEGQLGSGSVGGTALPPHYPQGLGPASSISAGYYHSCAVETQGTVKCWGDNSEGALGNGSTSTTVGVPTAQLVVGLQSVLTVSAGNQLTCAIVQGGAVKCWGSNGSGRLGNGSTVSSSVPVAVSGLTNAIAIAAGASHACAVRSDGTVWCWGSNTSGQLGNGSTTSSSVPVQVVGLENAVTVTAGQAHTCALRQDGTAWCWGAGGRLGDGSSTNSSTPVQVAPF